MSISVYLSSISIAIYHLYLYLSIMYIYIYLSTYWSYIPLSSMFIFIISIYIYRSSIPISIYLSIIYIYNYLSIDHLYLYLSIIHVSIGFESGPLTCLAEALPLEPWPQTFLPQLCWDEVSFYARTSSYLCCFAAEMTDIWHHFEMRSCYHFARSGLKLKFSRYLPPSK
jgi:hypothetical protein